MKKINILFILPEMQLGGAETQLLNLLKGLNRNKFNIHLGLLYKNNHLKDEFHNITDINIVYFNKKNSYDLKVYFKIAKFLKKYNIDIIQSFLGNHHSYLPSIISRRAIAIGGIRGTHDIDYNLIDEINEFVIPKFLSKHSDFSLISNSNKAKKIYLKKGFQSKAIHVIPNGINYENFCNGDREIILKEFSLHGKIVLSMVGRLVAGKNQESIIKIFKELCNDYDNLILVLIGDGSQLLNLQNLAKRLKLTDKIIFTQNRKDIPNLLAATNIFLFPSLFPEGWPNAVGEAMAAGLPVVSFDVGDVKYIIENGVDGFIAGRDINKLKQITIQLIEKSDLRTLIGRNAKEKIKNIFFVDAMINSYEKFYEKLLRSKHTH